LTWTDSLFVRCLIAHLLGSKASGSSEAETMAAIWRAVMEESQRMVPARKSGPSAEEVASDVIELILAGRAGHEFVATGRAMSYLAGIIRRTALSYDGKYRRRGEVAFDLDDHQPVDAAEGPAEVAAKEDLIAKIQAAWPDITNAQRAAIRAQFGAVFVDDAVAFVPGSKDYMAKHHGLNKLRQRILGEGSDED